jgi:uncharacterized protein
MLIFMEELNMTTEMNSTAARVIETESQSDSLNRHRKSLRGFASMDPSRQREIARKGGRAAHLKGTAHEFTSEEARVAGKKGGQMVSQDRAHMASIGREGGQARGLRFKQQRQEVSSAIAPQSVA